MTSENLYQAGVSHHASVEAEEFLPDFVAAWMLLQRSGLDGSERATIIASLKNHFTTEKVKEALKLNWTEEDLRKRDQTRSSALVAEDFEEDDAFLREGTTNMVDQRRDGGVQLPHTRIRRSTGRNTRCPEDTP